MFIRGFWKSENKRVVNVEDISMYCKHCWKPLGNLNLCQTPLCADCEAVEKRDLLEEFEFTKEN